MALRRAIGLLLLLALARPATAADDPAALAESWFRAQHGHDALEAYEAVTSRGRLVFTVARKWRNGTVSLLVDVREPREFRSYAFLLLQNRERSDDVFVYTSGLRKAKRLPSANGSLDLPLVGMVPIGEVRPFLPGELVYRALPDEQLGGVRATMVEATPVGERFRFDHLELAFAPNGDMLRSRYLLGDGELSRVEIAPADVEERSGRRVALRRTIRVSATGVAIELVQRNAMADAELPDRLFTRQSLIAGRFPSF